MEIINIEKTDEVISLSLKAVCPETNDLACLLCSECFASPDEDQKTEKLYLQHLEDQHRATSQILWLYELAFFLVRQCLPYRDRGKLEDEPSECSLLPANDAPQTEEKAGSQLPSNSVVKPCRVILTNICRHFTLPDGFAESLLSSNTKTDGPLESDELNEKQPQLESCCQEESANKEENAQTGLENVGCDRIDSAPNNCEPNESRKVNDHFSHADDAQGVAIEHICSRESEHSEKILDLVTCDIIDDGLDIDSHQLTHEDFAEETVNAVDDFGFIDLKLDNINGMENSDQNNQTKDDDIQNSAITIQITDMCQESIDNGVKCQETDETAKILTNDMDSESTDLAVDDVECHETDETATILTNDVDSESGDVAVDDIESHVTRENTMILTNDVDSESGDVAVDDIECHETRENTMILTNVVDSESGDVAVVDVECLETNETTAILANDMDSESTDLAVNDVECHETDETDAILANDLDSESTDVAVDDIATNENAAKLTNKLDSESANVSMDDDSFYSVECKICISDVLYTQLPRHLNLEHGETVQSYERTYDPDLKENMFVFCRECNQKIHRIESSFEDHLTKHNLDLRMYEENRTESKKTKKRKNAKETHVGLKKVKSNLLENCSTEGEKLTELISRSVSRGSMRILARKLTGPDEEKDPEKSKADPDEEKDSGLNKANGTEERYSDVPFDYCVYACELCDKQCRLDRLVKHIVHQHDEDWIQYKRKYSIQPKYEVLHKCKICNETICYDRQKLRSHLKSHGTVIQKYIQNYLQSVDSGDPKRLKSSKTVPSKSISQPLVLDIKQQVVHDVSNIKHEEMQDISDIKREKIPDASGANLTDRSTFDHDSDNESERVDAAPSATQADAEIDVTNFVAVKIEAENGDDSTVSMGSNGEEASADEPCSKSSLNQIEVERKFTGPGDYSTYICDICNYIGNYQCLVAHVRKHNLTIVDYREQYGVHFNEKISHDCNICFKEIHFCIGTILPHLRKHGLNSVGEYYDMFYWTGNGSRFSDSASDYSILSCEICGFEGPLERFRQHLRTSHSLSTPAYKAKHGGLSFKVKVLHNCKLCNKTIIFAHSNLKGHLSRAHDISLAEYRKKVRSNNVRKNRKENHVVCENALENSGGMDKADANNFRLSDIVGDYSVLLCKECGFEGNLAKFRHHTKNVHLLPIPMYKAKYGGLSYKEEVRHRCKLCNKTIIYTESNLKFHLTRKHDVTVESYINDRLSKKTQMRDFRLSDTVDDYAILSCKICEFEGKSDRFRLHVKKIHSLSGAEYKAKYGELSYKDKVRHVCRMCNKNILYTKSNLTMHVNKFHETTLEQYIKELLSKSSSKEKPRSESKMLGKEVSAGSPSSEGKRFKRIETYRENPRDSSDGANSSDGDNVAQVSGNEERTRQRKDNPGGEHREVRYSSLWGDFATFACRICDFSGEYRLLLTHIKIAHNLTSKEYRVKFGVHRLQDRVYHQCKFCSASIIFNNDSIVSHFRSSHPDCDYKKYTRSLSHQGKRHRPRSKKRNLNCFQSTDLKKENLSEENESDCRDSEDSAVRSSISISLYHKYKMRRTLIQNPPIQPKLLPSTGKQSSSYGTTGTNVNSVSSPADDTSLRPSGRLSDVPHDFSRYQCPQCDLQAVEEVLYAHCKAKHGTSIKKMKLSSGPARCVDRVFHRCKICKKKIFHKLSFMRRHLSKHKLTYTLYAENYLKKQNKTSSNWENLQHGVEPKPVSAISNRPGEGSVQNDTTEEATRTDSWFDGRYFSCIRCAVNSNSEEEIITHVLSNHDHQDMESTRELYCCTTPLFTCEVCQRKVPHHRKTVEAHLEGHFISLEDYKRLYLDPVSTPPSAKDTRSPNLEKFHGFDIGGEMDQNSENEFHGFEADPLDTSTMTAAGANEECFGFSTAELKSAISSLKKFGNTADCEDFVSESEPANESDCSDNQGDDDEELHWESDSAVLPDNSPSATRCPTPFLDHSILYPEVKIESMDCVVINMEPKSENIGSYTCPLCTFQTTFQGLQNGAGSAHLIDEHDLPFFKFKRSGLRWRQGPRDGDAAAEKNSESAAEESERKPELGTCSQVDQQQQEGKQPSSSVPVVNRLKLEE